MYSTCIFCHASLGANAVVEHFPVGRRLAFDAARGRLWAVCVRCDRWNLSPLEERWEAIEECERLFRATPLRASSGEVGLARVGEGLELVRIGKPEREEFVAWRYADTFARRRRRNLAVGAASGAGALALMWAAPLFGVAFGVATSAAYGLWANVAATQVAVVRTRVTLGGASETIELAKWHVARTRLVARGTDDFALEVPLLSSGESWMRNGGEQAYRPTRTVVLTGRDALSLTGMLLTRMNGVAGSRRSVNAALALSLRTPDAAALLASEVRNGSRRLFSRSGAFGVPYLGDLDSPARLALEMLTHEDQERRALDGELAELARAWREAEEVAAIADDMLVPPEVRGALERARRSP